GGAHLAAEVALLGAVRLVDEDDDVVAVVEEAVGFPELVDGGDDDLAGVVLQEALQLGAGLRLHQVGDVGGVEGGGDLGVEVDEGEAGEDIEHDVGAEEAADGGLHVGKGAGDGLYVFGAPGTPELDGHADRAEAELLAVGGDVEDDGGEELGDVLLVVVEDLE